MKTTSAASRKPTICIPRNDQAEMRSASIPGLVELIRLEVQHGGPHGPRSCAYLAFMVDELTRHMGVRRCQADRRTELAILTAQLGPRRSVAA